MMSGQRRPAGGDDAPGDGEEMLDSCCYLCPDRRADRRMTTTAAAAGDWRQGTTGTTMIRVSLHQQPADDRELVSKPVVVVVLVILMSMMMSMMTMSEAVIGASE